MLFPVVSTTTQDFSDDTISCFKRVSSIFTALTEIQLNAEFFYEWTIHYLKYFLNECCILTASLNIDNIYMLCKSSDDICYFDQNSAKYLYKSNNI